MSEQNGRDKRLPDNQGFTIEFMLERTSLAGQVGMIVCWWNDDIDMVEDAIRGVYQIPHLLSGRTEDFTKGDWWPFFDALGNFPLRDERLDELLEISKRGYFGNLPPGRTKCFDEEVRDWFEDKEVDWFEDHG